MRLLMFDAAYIRYRPTKKGWEQGDEVEIKDYEFKDVVLCFIHAEPQDEENKTKTVNKLLKNIKWLCGKLDKKRVLLHSFAHLGVEKAKPEFGREVLNEVEERLRNVGYEVFQTPFGWFLDFESKWIGHPLGRIYKEF